METGDWVMGGRSPAERTLEAFARLLTLTARELGSACVAWLSSPSGGEDSMRFCSWSTRMTEAFGDSVVGPKAVLDGDVGTASSARLLLCARCSAAVLVCRACGPSAPRYCGRACSPAPRTQARRAIAQRWQSGPARRAVHCSPPSQLAGASAGEVDEQPATTRQGIEC